MNMKSPAVVRLSAAVMMIIVKDFSNRYRLGSLTARQSMTAAPGTNSANCCDTAAMVFAAAMCKRSINRSGI